MKHTDVEPTFRRLIAGIVLLGVVGFAGAQDKLRTSPAPELAGKPALKVMSFNILYYRYWDPPKTNSWADRRRLVVAAIQTSGADIVGLQEATFPQVEYLRGKLEDEWGILATYREGIPTDKTVANAILYRLDRVTVDDWGTFWFSDTPDKPGSKGWGNGSARLCTWARFAESATGKTLYLYNAHLDHASQESRVKSAALIAEQIAQRKHKSSPVVLVGDLNAREDNPIIPFLKGAAELSFDGQTVRNPTPLADTFRVVHGDDVDVWTFHGFDKNRKHTKIDYVLLSNGAEALDARVLSEPTNGQYPSDHCPVTATIRLH